MNPDPRNPSTVTESYWLYAFREAGDYPEPTERSGKWLIFVSAVRVDALWRKIKQATEAGKLGGVSKVATGKSSPLSNDSRSRVICVYSYDWTDEEDVRRIRRALRKLGVRWRIPYKADADTDAGRYATGGGRALSKFYE